MCKRMRKHKRMRLKDETISERTEGEREGHEKRVKSENEKESKQMARSSVFVYLESDLLMVQVNQQLTRGREDS